MQIAHPGFWLLLPLKSLERYIIMQEQTTTRPSRKHISLRSITTRTEVFQFRHFDVDPHHVETLSAVLSHGNPLDRLSLWRDPESKELVVIDGHHRLEAYRQARWREPIPVSIYTCDIDHARLIALRENGKTRLPLTNEERMDAAWMLVSLNSSEYSKRVIVRTTGVGDGTVANMRRTRKALLKKDAEAGLPDHWWQAMARLKEREQREYTEEEYDAMIVARTAQLDEKIGRPLGDMAARQIQAAAAVVAKRLGRKGLLFLYEEHIQDEDRDGNKRNIKETLGKTGKPVGTHVAGNRFLSV